MSRPSPLARFLRDFRHDERGSLTVEFLLWIPIPCWLLLATVVFFQAFHAESLNVKVTYTIGDILSREDLPITPEYMDSMFALQRAMTGSDEPRALRVTAVTYREADRRYHVVWSQVRGGGTPHTDSTLAAIADTRLPVMSDGQTTILTETWLFHTPAFVDWVGIDPLTFYEVTTTRPRAPQFCWNASDDPAAWTETTNICNI